MSNQAKREQLTVGKGTLERGLRALGIGALLLATMLATWRVLSPDRAGGTFTALELRVDDRNADSAQMVSSMLARALVDHAVSGQKVSAQDSVLGTCGALGRVAATLTVVPSLSVRAVLESSAHAGMQLSWLDSTTVRDLALHASAVPVPSGGTLITATARAAGDSTVPAALTIRDAGGLLDSVASATASLRVRATQLSGSVQARVEQGGRIEAVAHVGVPAAVLVRGVRVFAAVGWEAKFVMAALEEAGWTVSGSVFVAPRTAVETGAVGTLDTVRHSVAVVLDSGVVSASTLQRFLAQGGGVVLAGHALTDGSLIALSTVRRAGARVAVPGAFQTDTPRRGLATWQVSEPAQAVVLERSGASPVITVERRGVGRVLVNGYQTTWRWRMEGNASALARHREWWSALVTAVAFVPATPISSAALGEAPTPFATPFADALARDASLPGDAAPVADLRARLGAPVSAFPISPAPESRTPLALWVLFVTAAVALLAEWALRRVRGAP